jgi:hypothetical protein
MKNSVFDEMFARYSPTTKDERKNAIHEVMQEITLAGLYRGRRFSAKSADAVVEVVTEIILRSLFFTISADIALNSVLSGER